MLVKNIISIVFFLFLLVGCSNKPPKNQCPPVKECNYDNYIEVEEVNSLLNFTNDLINRYNFCYNDTLEPLPKYSVIGVN